MKKSETINSFTEGLVVDTNPLVTPNNVLTNCLNGTFITYNGNEFILLNDMGNGRVESAYLPSGYVPIGIKEYGGIIYVASYNPLTNKGQIGSFPSPERNLDSSELSDSQANITESLFFAKVFQSTVKAKVFADNIVIRPGDKFSIILSNSDKADFPKLISHYDNIKTANGLKIIKSFKNKVLDIDLGVIDSSGRIKLITDQLKRINTLTGEVIKYDDTISPDVKFNDGFWALNSKVEEDITEYRKNKGINTYNSKLVGNLYVIASLNTIQSIDFSVYGEKTNNKASLTLDVTYRYNCPDGVYDLTKHSLTSQELGSADDNIISNVIGDAIFKLTNSLNNNVQYNIPFPSDDLTDLELTSYSYDNGIYTASFTHTINDININGSNDVRDYEFIPLMNYGTDKVVQLDGLKVTGALNLSNLGSGDIFLNTWRYYCDNKGGLTLTWGFEMYLRPKEEVTSLTFTFYSINKTTSTSSPYGITYIPTKRYNYNGVFTDVLSLNDGLNFGDCYYVKINLVTSKETKTFYRWVLFTGLYNELYYSLQDFNDDPEEMLKLRVIKLEEDTKKSDSFDEGLNYKINSSNNETVEDTNKIPITTNNSPMVGNVKKTLTIIYDIRTDFKFINPQLYPFECDKSKFTIEATAIPLIKDSSPIFEGDKIEEEVGKVDFSWDSSNKLKLIYTALSPYNLKKSETGDIKYTNVLTKYESVLKRSIGYSSDSVISTSCAIGFFIREALNGGGNPDHHGFAFYYMTGGQLWTALHYDDDTYTVKWEENGRIDFDMVTSGGYDKMVAAIGSTGTTPIFLLVCGDLNIIPQQNASGAWVRPLQNALDYNRMLLWYDGEKYCFVDSSYFFISPSASGNIMQTVLNLFKDMYVYQDGGITITDNYIPVVKGSSYTIGGKVNFNTSVKVTVTPLEDVIKNSYTLNNLEEFIKNIRNITGSTDLTPAIEANKMLFSVQELEYSSISIDKSMDLYNLTSFVNKITDVDTVIDTPIIYNDGSSINKIQTTDSNGSPINVNNVYTSTRKLVTNLATVKINNDYHIVPKTKGTWGNYPNYGDWGSGDSYSTLSFNNLPIINYEGYV